MNLRTLTVADAEAFRHFRIEALRESPMSFGASFQQEAEIPAEEWARRLGPDRGVVYGAFDTDARLVATLGVYVLHDEGDASGPWLWTMYVSPSVRRQGIGRRLLRRVVGDLRARGEARTLRLQVTGASPWARALYADAGFVVTKREADKPWHSGQTVSCEEMSLPLAGEA